MKTLALVAQFAMSTFVAACGARSELDGVGTAGTAGCTAETIEVGSSPVTDLAVDERGVAYWSTGGALFRHDTTSTVLAYADATTLAVDSTRVFYTLQSDGSLNAVARDGGAPVVLASGFVNPGAIAVQGSSVIVVDQADNGRVSRVDGDGSVNALDDVYDVASNVLVVDDVYAYVAMASTVETEIMRIDTHSGAASTVFSVPFLVSSVALDGANAYGVEVGTSWLSIVEAAKTSSDAFPTTIFTPSTSGTSGVLVADADGIFMTTATAPYGSASGQLWRVAPDGSSSTVLADSASDAFLTLRTSPTTIQWIAARVDGTWSVRKICK